MMTKKRIYIYGVLSRTYECVKRGQGYAGIQLVSAGKNVPGTCLFSYAMTTFLLVLGTGRNERGCL